MSSLPFHYIDLRAFSYATEDDKRVEQALRLFLPDDHEIDRARTEGYHGDRIVVFSTRIETANEMRTVLDLLKQTTEFRSIQEELVDRVTEDCELYLTLDKQRAFRGEVGFGPGITFRAKVEAYPAKKETAIANLESIF